jgi:hypothetical protein
VPTLHEGAAALASARRPWRHQRPAAPGGSAASGSLASETSITTIVPAAAMGHVASAYGELGLVPAAADAWNAMRAEASSV